MLLNMSDQRQHGGNNDGTSGWVDTETAAAALDVSARTVRNMIRRGDLDAKEEKEGITERYLVSIDSVYALRDKRKSGDRFRRDSDRRKSDGNTAELLREAIARLEIRAAENAELRTRLELTEKADSTLREQLERERERADRLELEARELREKLEETQRSWWRRLFSR